MILYIFYIICSPLLYLILHVAKFISPKIFDHLAVEKKLTRELKEKIKQINNKKILLFHAASAGEFEQIKPILRQLNKNNFFIIQSFTSPTIYHKEKNNNLFDICCYHPYDFLWSSYMFFKSILPDIYIITRHDVWPIHTLVCQYLKIPCYYINANVHKKSIWSYKILKSFTNRVLSKFDMIFVPSNRIKQNIIQILESNAKITVTGDTRFDQIIDRKNRNNDHILPSFYLKKNNIIFGSYDSYDEKIILDSIRTIFPNGDKDLKKNNIGIILVPHEVHYKNINNLIIQLNKTFITPSTFTNLANMKNNNLIIIDKVGILADLYKYANLAYVGSGFTTGVHSVIEPAIYGCTIGHGPEFELLDEAKDMHNNNLTHVITSASDMIQFMNLINEKEKLQKKEVLQNYVKKYSGASAKIIKGIGL